MQGTVIHDKGCVNKVLQTFFILWGDDGPLCQGINTGFHDLKGLAETVLQNT